MITFFMSSYLFAQEKETIRKTTKTSGDFLRERIYYVNGKEVARDIWDKEGNRKIVGKIPDGLVKEYDENGQLVGEDNYKNGELDGLSRLYGGKDRHLLLEINYKNGKARVWKTYYENGVLRMEINYKNGKRNGIERLYTKNEKLGIESNWKDGKRDGITKIYWEDGDIIAYIDTYKNGEKINRKAYGREGKLEFDQDYPYIEKEGKVK